ncbi:hypothetical protein MK079_05695, partial [Candidatus Gracilibacteria bacterium]|nr:hypothetical protein [Candidatus Gracilibacteria bacterium]
MFTTFDFIKQQLRACLFCTLEQGDIQAALAEDVPEETRKTFLKENTDALIAYLHEIDDRYNDEDRDVQGGDDIIGISDFNPFSKDKRAVRLLLVELGFDGFGWTGRSIEDIQSKLKAYQGDKQMIVTKTQDAKEEVQEEVKQMLEHKTVIPTKETENKSIKSKLRQFDQHSYERFLIDLFDALQGDNLFINDTKITQENIDEIMGVPSSNLKLKKAIYAHFGYKDSRGWFGRSFSHIFGGKNSGKIIERIQNNADAVDISSLDSMKNYLFDFDHDSDIDTASRDAVTEAHFDDMVFTIDILKHVIENLGYGRDLEQIKHPSFKLKFTTLLVEALKMRIPATALTKQGGLKEYTNLSIQYEKDLRTKIAATFSDEAVGEELKKQGISNTPENIELTKKWTIMASFGHIRSLGVTKDISEITKGFLNSTTIGADHEGNLAFSV